MVRLFEEKGALVRIPVAGKVCAYALDPHEVWKGYNTSKDYSAFVTKTLVNKDGEIKRRIMAMFSERRAVKSSSEATLDGSERPLPIKKILIYKINKTIKNNNLK